MRYRKDLLVIGCYTLLTIVLTYPVFFRITSEIAGFEAEDNLQWRWFLWWFKHSLLTLQTSVTDVSILFAPTGGEQPLYAIASFTPALALPITLFGGPTLSFNLSFLLSFALSGYTAYLLAYYLTRHRLAAFVAGLIFGFFPARFGYATGTFLGQLTTYFLPLYVLSLFMLARRPSAHRAVWAAIVLAGLCLTWPLHVAYGVVIFSVVFFIFLVPTWIRQPDRRQSIKYFALTFGLALIIIIGLYTPLIRTVLQGKGEFGGDTVVTGFSIDLLAFISPSNHHPIWKPLGLLPDYATQVLADYNDIQERLAYVGVIPALLALIGFIKYKRQLWFWLVTALITMILSLGPLLKFNGGPPLQIDIDGYVGYIVLPYALFKSWPILSWSGVLGRLNVATMLCVGVMAAYGISYLVSNLKSGGQMGLVSLFSALILLEFLTIFPFPTEPDVVPDFYERLRQEAVTKPQTIIDLPLVGNPAYNNYSMHYQTLHHQPLAGGHFMRKPAGTQEMVGFINQLLSPPLNQSVVSLPSPEDRLALLSKFGFTKIVTRLELMTGDQEAQAQFAYLSTWLGQPHPEGGIAVFEIPPEGTSPNAVTTLLAGRGWQPIEDPAQLQLQSPADLLVYLDGESDYYLTLQLSLSAPHPDRYLSIDLNGQPAMRVYLSQETLTYHIPLYLPPGAHQLTFRPEEACNLNCAPVNFTHLALVDTAGGDKPVVTFGNQLTLLSYNVSNSTTQPGQPILIYLYWQGQGRTSSDYSVFVHLVSPSGELVHQADYLLGGWLYPTSRWPDGHLAATPTLFFVPPDTMPGEYQLRTGIYLAESGERLLIRIDAGEQDSVLLSTLTVTP